MRRETASHAWPVVGLMELCFADSESTLALRTGEHVGVERSDRRPDNAGNG
jgi:hypothetical protein